MSKRKKTPTSKNTRPKLTKAQLTRKINALDKSELAKLAGQKGIIGAAFRINYKEIGDDYGRNEAVCSKCIQPMAKLLATSERYGLVDNEGDDKALSNSVAALTQQIYNKEVPASMAHFDLTAQVDILFTMLMAYVFTRDVVKNYCEEHKEGTVGINVVFDVTYTTEDDSYNTSLSIRSFDDFNNWTEASNELIAEDKATILRA
jgi:hypothetical protein